MVRQRPMPSVGSGEMFGGYRVPNEEARASPPPRRRRSGWPGWAWQEAQSPAAKINFPRAGSPPRSSASSASFEHAALGLVMTQTTGAPIAAAPAIAEARNRIID